MDQFALIHFASKQNDKTFFFVCQPGVPYLDALGALEEFKVEIERLKKEGEEREAAAKAAQASEPIEAEVISE